MADGQPFQSITDGLILEPTRWRNSTPASIATIVSKTKTKLSVIKILCIYDANPGLVQPFPTFGQYSTLRSHPPILNAITVPLTPVDSAVRSFLIYRHRIGTTELITSRPCTNLENATKPNDSIEQITSDSTSNIAMLVRVGNGPTFSRPHV